jgi:hypothetical protein
MDEEMRIRKIHVNTLIQVLVELYDRGLEYVDIIGQLDDVQDTIGLSFGKEYMYGGMEENYDDIPTSLKNMQKGIDLSDDNDLNQII